MSKLKVIYLGPECQENGDGREWCQDDVWERCECGHESVRYVIGAEHDRVTAERDALQLRLNAADERIDELIRQARVESVCRGSAALGTACEKCSSLRLVESCSIGEKHDGKIHGMIETACGNFAIMIDEANAHYGWTFKKDPNDIWVSGRKATEAEMNAARAHAKILALF